MHPAITVGKHTYGADNIRIDYAEDGYKLTIGAFCSIAPECRAWLGGNHRTDWITTYPLRNVFPRSNAPDIRTSRGNVVIGNDAWIANNVTIMSGVTICDGAVIANNSHVVKDVGPYEIWGGNPAQLIRARLSEYIIARLIRLQWWNMDDKVIEEIAPILCSDNYNALFDRFL